MAGEEPVVLPVGTEVSAKYRGAFCEAKVKKIVKCVKCKVTITDPRSQIVVTDEDVKGLLKTGSKVEVKHPETGLYVEASFNKLTDCSMYTVVFDDGDENTLRRTQLCLKGEKHFVKSETLDQLPLTHPEHFGTPVMKSYKGTKRRRANMSGPHLGLSDSDSESEASECSSPRKRIYKGRNQEMVGRVSCMEIDDRKKTTWVPVLVIMPSASDMELKTRDHLLVKSFKDSRLHTVCRKDTKEFTRDMAIKNEDKTLKPAMEKALAYFDSRDLPSNWDREELLGQDSDEEDESDTSDDEPSEEKDHFVAQLYKFMDDRDTPINKAPSIGARDLNLYRLFKLVRNLGGYNKVTNLMKWKMVYSKMNLPPSGNAYNQIKTAYKKYLHAYEDFYRKLGSTMGNRPGRTRHSSGRSLLSFRERENAQPKSPRAAEKKREEKAEEEKVEEEKKSEEKKEEEKAAVVNKGKESEKKDLDAKGTKKSEDRKSAVKEETDVDTDSPRKRRSRAAGDKKCEEKVKEKEEEKEKEKPASKRLTREDAAKMKDDSKGKEEQERARRSTSKKMDDTEEKEEALQKRRSVPMRKKKVEEKEDPKKKVPEEPISDGGPDDDSDDGEEEDEPSPPPPKEEFRKDVRRHRELALGTKLKVRYGRGRNQKIYEAKVVEAEQEAGSIHYLVHYAGWNNRYDEWVMRDRIVAVVSEGPDNESKKFTIAKKLISPKTSSIKKLKRPPPSSPSPTPKQSETKQGIKSKPGTPTSGSGQKSRPTRSSGSELSISILPTRRSRRGSGIGDNASDLQSHVSGSESDEDDSGTDEKKGDTDDTDSSKTKSDKQTRTKSNSKTASKGMKKEEATMSDSESGSCDGEKEGKPKIKSETRGQAKFKTDVKSELSPASAEVSDDESIPVEPVRRTPGKGTLTRLSKMMVKSDEPTSSPSTSFAFAITEEPMHVTETVENKASELLAKDEDAQSDDTILKGIDMGDILVYPDSDMSIAPPKPKATKDMIRGKRSKSTDSVDDVSRQDSLDTVAYGYDIQDAVQNILDQLDQGDEDSDDLSFLTPSKDAKVLFHGDGEKKEDHKPEKAKKEKKGDKEKGKEKGEKTKPKGSKKIEKLISDEIKQELKESDTEKEKKHDGEKKKKVKKKKVKKKVEGKESDKDGKAGEVVGWASQDTRPVVGKTELDLVPESLAAPQAPNDDVTSPPQLAAITPNKEEPLSKMKPAGIEVSPLPPKLKAEWFDLPKTSNDRPDDDQGAPVITLPPPIILEPTIITAPAQPPIATQVLSAPLKSQPKPQTEPLSSASSASLPSVVSSSSLSSSLQSSTSSVLLSTTSLAVTSSSTLAAPCPSKQQQQQQQQPEAVVVSAAVHAAAISSTPAATVLVTASSSPSRTCLPLSGPALEVSIEPASPSSQQTPATLFDNTPPETPEGSPEAPSASDVTKAHSHISMESPATTTVITTTAVTSTSISASSIASTTVSTTISTITSTTTSTSIPTPIPTPAPTAILTSTSITTPTPTEEPTIVSTLKSELGAISTLKGELGAISTLKGELAMAGPTTSVVLPPGDESPNACDTSTISNGSDGSNGNMPSSEDSTEGSSVMAHMVSNKRKIVDESQQPPKKRKRGPKRGAASDKSKILPKHTMSDSDDAADGHSVSPKHAEMPSPMMANAKNTPNKMALPNQSPSASGSSGNSPGGDEPRPPRTSKYNFNLEEGNYLEGDQRIIFIMEKLTEIRKIYMSLKAEVACIDRRRKRAKRREKEGTALTLASLANS